MLSVQCWGLSACLSHPIARATPAFPLHPCNGRSSSPQRVLLTMQAAALDQADRQAQQWETTSVSSTRTTNGSKREESWYGRRAAPSEHRSAISLSQAGK